MDKAVFTGGSLQCAKTQQDTEITIYDLNGTTITIGEPPDAVIPDLAESWEVSEDWHNLYF